MRSGVPFSFIVSILLVAATVSDGIASGQKPPRAEVRRLDGKKTSTFERVVARIHDPDTSDAAKLRYAFDLLESTHNVNQEEGIDVVRSFVTRGREDFQMLLLGQVMKDMNIETWRWLDRNLLAVFATPFVGLPITLLTRTFGEPGRQKSKSFFEELRSNYLLFSRNNTTDYRATILLLHFEKIYTDSPDRPLRNEVLLEQLTKILKSRNAVEIFGADSPALSNLRKLADEAREYFTSTSCKEML